MIATNELPESWNSLLLRETVSAATALGELREGQRRTQLELTAISIRLTAAEASIMAMTKTSPPSSSTPTDTLTLKSALSNIGPSAMKWVGEKVLGWLTYYITPLLLGLWGFANEQFWALVTNVWLVARLGFRMVGF